MAQQTIFLGTVANDGTGDPARSAFDICNDNFTELYGLLNGNITASGLDSSATDKLIGRSTAGAGALEEIACTSFGRSLLDDLNAAAGRATLSAAVIGANGDITSMTALSGTLAAPTAIVSTTGLSILKFSYTPSAVNEFTLKNATAASGDGPSFLSTGSDTNIAATFGGKGTGAVILGQATCAGVMLAADQPILDSSGLELLKFVKTATAVNEFTITNAATGSGPIWSATGGDTNIDIFVTPKGTGKTKFATGINIGTSISSVGNTTYFSFIDAGASAINYIIISNATAGNNPKITGGGGSADVTLELNAQGAGDIYLNPTGAGLVKFGTYTATPGSITGYITMKDAGGTSRKIAVTS